jgi:hypothetical protein
MFRKESLAPIRVIIAVLTVAGVGLFASPAFAISANEPVAGTTQGSLALTAGGGAVFTTSFAPGQTATTAGLLTVTDTNPSWNLAVQDSGTGGGKMIATTGATCTGSDAQLTNPLQVTVSSPLGGVTSAGQKSISGSGVTVASATNQLLAANALTTSYSQTIPSGQTMLAGCLYSLTATYTLQ